jgi:hypothetical protein
MERAFSNEEALLKRGSEPDAGINESQQQAACTTGIVWKARFMTCDQCSSSRLR